MGFEPTTSTLARLRSTPELRPHLPHIIEKFNHQHHHMKSKITLA